MNIITRSKEKASGSKICDETRKKWSKPEIWCEPIKRKKVVLTLWRRRLAITVWTIASPTEQPNPTHQKRRKQNQKAFNKCYERYSWDGVYDELLKKHYKRSFSGMVYAAKRLGLNEKEKKKQPPRKQIRRYPELLTPGEKVQIDVGGLYDEISVIPDDNSALEFVSISSMCKNSPADFTELLVSIWKTVPEMNADTEERFSSELCENLPTIRALIYSRLLTLKTD